MRGAPPSRPPLEPLRSPPSAPGAWRGDGRGWAARLCPALRPRRGREGAGSVVRAAAAVGAAVKVTAGRGPRLPAGTGSARALCGSAGPRRCSHGLRTGCAGWVLPVPGCRGPSRSRLSPGGFCGRSEGGRGVLPPARCNRAKCQAWFWSPPAFGCVISKEGLPRMSEMR